MGDVLLLPLATGSASCIVHTSHLLL